MPFKDPPRICKLKDCSQPVDNDLFNGYCCKRHEDIAKMQQLETDVERPTPLTSVPIQSEGYTWKRATVIPTRRGYNYTTKYPKGQDDSPRKDIFRVTSSGLYLKEDPADGGVQQLYSFDVDHPKKSEQKVLHRAYEHNEKLGKTATRAKF
ncbi:uncharacterized protein MONOS_8290 [Monocercomonoides exilis]|uniref:uncharacterized protein n=1 Tax=Monocercomonoides exilis TaxID=2049356 RepID=UPI00355AA777|nr:hypothetical protein MONOS_8290 [Monocercomonoides exilis]|eukprot:MONOS_8290.1-p1 / transcript=MONOS_8290.1 / gene=MONOS_8290 / organism=Monocercomonoides_exilis_PA203 / gene_product=unspecified product / transcript_product=unspecified product / location=Mono_scaffold00309:16099-16622(-) / protein_length=151 / sequence_SO=supercontig / SO=protein_coding / is_pseudo=false